MRYYWTDERYQIIYSKRVNRVVKIVDSCSSSVHCSTIMVIAPSGRE